MSVFKMVHDLHTGLYYSHAKDTTATHLALSTSESIWFVSPLVHLPSVSTPSALSVWLTVPDK